MSYLERTWKLALIDIDGTLCRGHEVIQGAPDFIRRLRDRGIQPVFFTNNATRTPQQAVDWLGSLGFDAAPNEVCTAAQASAHRIRERTGQGAIVAYIGVDGLKEALKAEELEPLWVRSDDFEARKSEASAAVLGLDRSVTYGDFARFGDVVMRLNHFVLTNGDVRLPVEGSFHPGNGALGRFVETATGVCPEVMGKPEAGFVAFALNRYGAKPAETIMVGDNLLTDILAGIRAGLYSIHVTSGVSYDNQTGVDLPKPNEVFESVADLFRSVD